MPIHNGDVAAVFTEIADLLEVEGENPFRVRAYRGAARTVDGLGQSIASLVEQGEDLTELAGIGKDLAAKIEEICKTGKLAALETLRQKLPADISRMLNLPGLGPKRVATLYHDLGIGTLADLEAAARAGRIRELPGLGAKTEKKILDAVVRQADMSRRFLRVSVEASVDALLDHLRHAGGVTKVEMAGSYRRGKETVGDLDILATAAAAGPVMERFVAFDEVDEVLARGDTKSSVVLRSGVQVDLRVVGEEHFGAAMHYFTGSKEHNIALRRLAQQQGLKLSEYGVHKGDVLVAGRTEEEVFGVLGLRYVEPELREDRGEVDAARENRLPDLVEARDIRGDLHNHSTASDGKATVEEMALAAKARGYAYIAITDHSKRLTVANGLDEDRLRRQVDEIAELNERLEGITVLAGSEVDILEDGTLDLSDDVLGLLDLVVASVHSRFNLTREKQTERILRAMDQRYVSILGHPSGRLLLKREPYEVDMERVMDHAKERGCFLELNANPERLDLHDIHCRMARDRGILVSIDTDAHRPEGLDYIRFGVAQGRRAWLEKKDVLNTRSLAKLKPLLAATMG